MRRVMLALMAGALIVSVSAPSAQAQVAWDAPLMVSPETPAGWGVYLVDPSPGNGIGVLSTWRPSSGSGVGYRLGIAEDRRDDVSVYGGIDLSGVLVPASNDFPVHVNWVVGAGLGVADDVLLSFPLALSFGRSVQADGVWFNPYVAPRVSLDAYFGDGSDLNLNLSVDLGVDVSFDPGWAVRFAGSLGDRKALAIGMSFRVF